MKTIATTQDSTLHLPSQNRLSSSLTDSMNCSYPQKAFHFLPTVRMKIKHSLTPVYTEVARNIDFADQLNNQ